MSTNKKKRKKKKLTKKQREALRRKQEEEERLRLEKEEEERRAEEERIQKEKEENERRERERIRREAEIKRLSEERIIFKPTWDIFTNLYKKEEAEVSKRREWLEYLKCSPLPSPSEVSAINSYVSLWRSSFEDNNYIEGGVSQRDIKSDFHECGQAVELYYSVEREMLKCEDEEEKNVHESNLKLLSKSLYHTFDDITCHLMQFSEVFMDGDTSQFNFASKYVQFGLWINNLKKKSSFAKHVNFKEIGAFVELKLRGASFLDYGIRFVHYPIDFLTPRCKEHSTHVPIGGIIYIDFLDMPPAPQTNRSGWNVRRITPLTKRLQRRPYKDFDLHKNEIDPDPTKVSFRVRKDVLMRKDIPRLAWWDPRRRHWSQEGILLDTVRYEGEKERLVSFSTTRLTTAIAVVHERVFDVPFRRWLLLPLPSIGRNCGAFIVTLKEHKELKLAGHEKNVEDLVFLVWGDRVRLSFPVFPEFQELNEGWMEVGEMLSKLSASGIVLTLEDEDAENADISPKGKEVEKKAYKEMGLLGTCMAFSSSRWNHDVHLTSENQCIFRVHNEIHDPSEVEKVPIVQKDGHNDDEEEDYEESEDEDDEFTNGDRLEYMEKKSNWEFLEKELASVIGDSQEEWVNVLFDEEKALLMKCKENTEELSLEGMEGMDTEVNLIVALEKSENHKKDIRNILCNADMIMGNTFRKLLEAIRPLSWS